MTLSITYAVLSAFKGVIRHVIHVKMKWLRLLVFHTQSHEENDFVDYSSIKAILHLNKIAQCTNNSMQN